MLREVVILVQGPEAAWRACLFIVGCGGVEGEQTFKPGALLSNQSQVCTCYQTNTTVAPAVQIIRGALLLEDGQKSVGTQLR